MKFVSLLEFASQQGVNNINDFMSIRTDVNELKLARPFIFSYEEGGKVAHTFGRDDIPALPFDICSIELEKDGMIHCAGFGKGDFWIASFIVKELEPGRYHFYALGSVDGVTLDAVIFTDSGLFYNNLINVTETFIKRIATEKTGICKCNEKVKLKKFKNGLKNHYKIKDYLYVTKGVNSLEISGNGHSISFTHSFDVRGHWRKIKGIGINRTGQRIVKNSTWVRPYIKGDLTQPKVTKARIVY